MADEQKKSRWEQYKEKNGVTPLDLLNPRVIKIDESHATARLDICKQCPELIPVLNQCKKCGCFMTYKTTLKGAKCPLGKW